MKKFTKKDYAIFLTCILISVFAISYNEKIKADNAIYFPRALSEDDIKKYSNTDNNAVIIYPIFTQNAYKDGGFYDYFKGICKTCDSIQLDPKINATYITGLSGFNYLRHLNYNYITDIDVDKDPHILKKYDKIILLHNEYMTENEFNAITSHGNTIYLYPNSAYAKISVNYDTMTESLVRGHGYDIDASPPYPVKKGTAATNGFGYVTSSDHEYDLNCENYKWQHRPNGMEITCWPEFLIKSDRSVLQTIKDYPEKSPDLITLENKINMSSLPKCNAYGYCN